MRTNKKHSLYVAALIMWLPSFAISANLCLAEGYTLGFFNGVWNTPEQAAYGLKELQSTVGFVYGSRFEPVKGRLFYNHTGSTVRATAWQDLAEVFDQRAREIDSSGELAKRREFFWESLSGNNQLFTKKLLQLYPSAQDHFTKLNTKMASQMAATLSNLFSKPPTESDYLNHNAALDKLAQQRKKLILVAHSQGNLFMNKAYDHIVPTLTPDSVKTYHIAPASPTLTGDWILSSSDVVINGLRTLGPNSVPPVNWWITPSTSDISGHELINTYLDKNRDGRTRIANGIHGAMQQLITPPTTGVVGSFSIILSDSYNKNTEDADLHIFEPNGSHVFYASPQGAAGKLVNPNDFSLSSRSPEQYYGSCDSDTLQAGTYRIGITYKNEIRYENGKPYYANINKTRPFEAYYAYLFYFATPTAWELYRIKLPNFDPAHGRNQSPLFIFDLVVKKDPAKRYVTIGIAGGVEGPPLRY